MQVGQSGASPTGVWGWASSPPTAGGLLGLASGVFLFCFPLHPFYLLGHLFHSLTPWVIYYTTVPDAQQGG